MYPPSLTADGVKNNFPPFPAHRLPAGGSFHLHTETEETNHIRKTIENAAIKSNEVCWSSKSSLIVPDVSYDTARLTPTNLLLI